MQIGFLTIGAILLLWSHLVWLVTLQMSSWQYLVTVDMQ